MKLISTKIHGLLDYCGSILLIMLPWIFNFNLSAAQKNIPVICGTVIIAYSVLTDYELGLLKLIPMKVHLIFDVVIGLFLALSPWLFGFTHYFWLPHSVSGILIVIVSLITRKNVEYNRQFF